MAVMGPLRPDEERMFHGQPKGFPLSDFNVEDVMLPEVHPSAAWLAATLQQLVAAPAQQHPAGTSV